MVINIPNVDKIFQIAIKYINIFQSLPYEIFPNWEFWFENKPSGNPALEFVKTYFFEAIKLCKFWPQQTTINNFMFMSRKYFDSF
jgi:hypothetical protein